MTPASRGAAPNLPELATNLAAQDESFWRMCRKQPEALTARDLFAYAFTLCEAREHPERLERLFSLTAQMQDRNQKSRSFGNFWWSMSDKKVLDYNSVDFCMRGGSLLWLKDRNFIPAPARAQLE